MAISEKRKILLISYQFCPKGQIGTRRWSKFAKYLTKNGFQVHVLCAKYPYYDEINWCHDVNGNKDIIVHPIFGMYPTFLLQPKRTFWVKIWDRIFSHSFNYLDKAQNWSWLMVPKAKSIIKKEGITNIIVTGAPFSTLYQSALLKRRNSSLNIILDLRDPWTISLPAKTFFQKFVKQKNAQLEAFAFRTANLVMHTTQALKNSYSELYPNLAPKFRVLHNGFDLDDFKNLTLEKGKPLHIIYAGSLMKERVNALVMIARTLASMDDPFVIKHLKIDLYGYFYQSPEIEDLATKNAYNKFIEYKGVLSQKEIFQKLAKCDICLSINAMGNHQIITAKTFDYMGLNKKIFLISEPNELSEILNTNDQYVATYSTSSIREAIVKMKNDHLGQEGGRLKGVQYQDFSYDEITNNLISYIEELC